MIPFPQPLSSQYILWPEMFRLYTENFTRTAFKLQEPSAAYNPHLGHEMEGLRLAP